MKKLICFVVCLLLLVGNAHAADTWGAAGTQASLGSNIVTNGDFTSATGWTAPTGWSISAGIASHNADGTGSLSRSDLSVTSGHQYYVELNTATIGGSPNPNNQYVRIKINSVHIPTYNSTENETYYVQRGAYTATSTGSVSIALEPDNGLRMSFDDFIVKDITASTAEATIDDSDGTTLAELRGRDSFFNLFLGRYSGRYSMTNSWDYGANNVAVGPYTMNRNVTGYKNTAVGTSALKENTGGASNTAIGFEAMTVNTGGFNNTAVGNAALHAGKWASYNTAIGHAALYSATDAIQNIAIGVNALYGTNTDYNIGIGASALGGASYTGSHGIAIGVDALKGTTTGNYNQGAGHEALRANTTGGYNSCWGHQCLVANTEGGDNTCMGYQCLSGVAGTNGSTSKNTALGTQAGYNLASGRENVFIGAQATAPCTTCSYQMNIANLIYGDLDDGTASIGQNTPETNAILTLTSTSKPLLLPRMTTTQQNAVSIPVNGMIIYNSTTGKFHGYAGGAWVALH